MSNVSSSNSQEAKVPRLRFPEFEGEWCDTCLKAIAEYLHIRGQAEKKYFISTENINQDCAGITPYKEKDITEGIAFNNDDLLLANIRPYLKKLWKATFKGICSTDVLAIRAKAVNPNFLYYAMCREAFFNYVMSGAKGSKMPRGDKTHIMDFCLTLPSEIEQKKIAEFISCLEKRIAVQRQLVKALKSYKRGVLSRLFPKNGASVPEYRFSGFTGDWEQRKLGELGEIITGSTPSTSHEEYYSADGIPWVTPTDISENVIYDTPRKLSDEGQKVGRVVPKNTILVTCIASIGKNAILGTTGSFNQQINGIVPNYKMFVPYFLFTESALWSEKMKKQAAAGTMQIVNKTEFSELQTRVPNYQEQEQISTLFLCLDHLITLHQRKLDEYKSIKQGLLEKLFI